MELFKLLGTIAIDNSGANSAIDGTTDKAEKSESKISSAFGKIGSAAVKVGAVVVSGLATAATAIGALSKKALDEYAEYEQLVGGVETLFKDSSSKVKKYADEAYESAGLSANEYMSTVTSFSASLLQSLARTTVETGDMTAEELDRQYEAVADANEEKLELLEESHEAALESAKKAQRSELDALIESLDKQYEAVADANEEKLELLEESHKAELDAFEKLTDAKIALIDKQYKESLKLIDEELYNKTKAIDAQIDALNDQTQAERDEIRKREQAQKEASLREKVNTAKDAAARIKAEQELADFLADIAQEAREKQRKEQIESLKAQKDAAKEEADAKKQALQEQYEAEIKATKEASEEKLEAIKKAQKEEMDALKKSNEEQLKEIKKAQKEEIEAKEEANETQLNALKKAQKKELEELKKANSEKLAETKDYVKQQKAILEEAATVSVYSSDVYEKAAEKANQAIIDMSDNANKMGTDMGMIQNAYQGFAKQNFTMLDNLKLGYSGTQEEMKRLLADAEALSGVSYDIKSYADIVDAIHVIQTEMGITGTTADEASSTIQGSVTAMKAAWTNLVTSFGNENANLSDQVDDFVGTAQTAAGNITERLGVILTGIGSVISQIVEEKLPGFKEAFTNAAEKITETFSGIGEKALPIVQGAFEWIETHGVPILGILWQTIQDGWSLVAPVIEEAVTKTASLVGEIIGVVSDLFNDIAAKFGGVEEMFSKLSGVVLELYEFYLSNLIDDFRMLVETWETVLLPVLRLVIDIVIELAESIAVHVMPAVQNIISKFSELASSIRTAVTEYILPCVQSFIAMIEELWLENQDKITLIGELFGVIADWIRQQIDKIVDGFQKYLMPVIEWAADTIRENMDKIKAVIQAAIDVVSGIIKIFIALFKGDWEGLWTAVKDTLKAGYDFIVARFEMIKEFLSDILSTIRDACAEKWGEITDYIEEKVDAAKEKVSSVFDSIGEKIETIMENIKTTVKNAIDKVKEFFNFDVKLPDIKLPHFDIQPSGWEIGDLLQGEIPSLGVDWYAKGGVMTKPTAFGVNGNRVMAGGEAGPEAIAPIDVLQDYVSQAVEGQNAALVIVLKKILDAIIALDENMGGNLRDALDGMGLGVNHREFARLVKAVN